jgi:hypothetical protein
MIMSEANTTEPKRARAVLSTQDFDLIREAVLFYLQNNVDKEGTAKFSNLYHRLGSAAKR